MVIWKHWHLVETDSKSGGFKKKIVVSLHGKECKLASNPSVFQSGFKLLPAWKISPILTRRSQTMTCLMAPDFRLGSFIRKCFAKYYLPRLECLTQDSMCCVSRSEACIAFRVWNSCRCTTDTGLFLTYSQCEEDSDIAGSSFQVIGRVSTGTTRLWKGVASLPFSYLLQGQAGKREPGKSRQVQTLYSTSLLLHEPDCRRKT